MFNRLKSAQRYCEIVDKSGLSKRNLARSQSGVAAIEYALLASLIAVAIVGALTATGGKVRQNWNSVDQSMPGGADYQT